MRALIDLQSKLFPDLLSIMQRRYETLTLIQLMEPIGRRSLADHLNIAERTVRTEIDLLHEQGLIEVTTKGMHVTNTGKNVIVQLETFMNELRGFKDLEQKVKQRLQLDHVVIVPGDSDELSWVKQEMGKACVRYMKEILRRDDTVAVTGGGTIAAVAEMMTPLEQAGNCLFVPARGGLGEHMENQANTICAEMAKKANGTYRLLYVPDPLSEESYQTIIEEPSIKDVLELIRGAGVVVHGIGDAITMAERRKTPQEVIDTIQEGKAVGEAFGYYFNEEGHIVHKVRTVGIQLEDLQHTNCVIAVAGGKSKAKAISSYFNLGQSNVLITDESAAKELIKGSSL
ncbi:MULTISPECIES: sugar-binding transcriptional regulator [Pontibacillus]|uniref:Sugar-binding transcriptional regulator n=1 Tax=Pontibacillus chungwhensis TaxID=265426 RepID=A0ABY8UYR3_9BACI|nr:MULTISPECIES: sugar-binding transcriptional regulator [Pontibacillus]MCD5325297.1 sugar-binding transcriptional regulator [Pontibacillus sp. HN14]WIF97540.1 sugar-binding transcriptional regulator [Pontibacillus chungwhensis]